jgi:hypothetical protein
MSSIYSLTIKLFVIDLTKKNFAAVAPTRNPFLYYISTAAGKAWLATSNGKYFLTTAAGKTWMATQ